MTRRAQVVAALAVLCALVLPSSSYAGALDIPAAAPPRFRALLRAKLHMPPPRQGFESRFDLQAQHGYVVSVVGEGDIVAVEVRRPTHPRKGNGLEKLLGLKQAETAYVARGTVTPHRIAADFGQFGSVDVRFRPSGQVVESQAGPPLPGNRPLHQQARGLCRWRPLQRREALRRCALTPGQGAGSHAAASPLPLAAGGLCHELTGAAGCPKAVPSTWPFSPRPRAMRSRRSS